MNSCIFMIVYLRERKLMMAFDPSSTRVGKPGVTIPRYHQLNCQSHGKPTRQHHGINSCILMSIFFYLVFLNQTL